MYSGCICACTHIHTLRNNRPHTNTGFRLLNGHFLTGVLLFLIPCDNPVPDYWEAGWFLMAPVVCVLESQPPHSCHTFYIPISSPRSFHFCSAANWLATLTIVSSKYQYLLCEIFVLHWIWFDTKTFDWQLDFLLFKIFKKFIYLPERDRDNVTGRGTEKEGEQENPKQALNC